mgnify:CR=1 FL=1
MFFHEDRFTWVDVEVTNYCNFNCWFCPRNAMTRKKGMMDYEDYKDMVINLNSADFLKEILIGGIGEPTLHPHIIKMLSFIKQNTTLRAVLITNGSKFRDRSFVERLFKTNIDKVIISYRISDPVKNKTSLPPNFDYDEYVTSLLDFVELKYRHNYNTEIEVAFFKNTYYSKFILDINLENFINEDRLNDFVNRISNIIKVDLKSYNDYVKSISSHLGNVENIPVYKDLKFRFDGPSAWTTAVKKNEKPNQYFPARYGSCLGLLEHFAIYWNGDVSTCCADFDVNNYLGNIFKDKDIVKILSNPQSQFFAKRLRKRRMPTKTCQICRGGKSQKEKWANILGTILYTN